MSISPPVARTLGAAWIVLAAWLALAAPWLVLAGGCQVEPSGPSVTPSSGDELLNPEPERVAATAELNKPIDINNPEDRTPTVTAPPALPPDTAEGGTGAAAGGTGG